MYSIKSHHSSGPNTVDVWGKIPRPPFVQKREADDLVCVFGGHQVADELFQSVPHSSSEPMKFYLKDIREHDRPKLLGDIKGRGRDLRFGKLGELKPTKKESKLLRGFAKQALRHFD